MKPKNILLAQVPHLEIAQAPFPEYRPVRWRLPFSHLEISYTYPPPHCEQLIYLISIFVSLRVVHLPQNRFKQSVFRKAFTAFSKNEFSFRNVNRLLNSVTYILLLLNPCLKCYVIVTVIEPTQTRKLREMSGKKRPYKGTQTITLKNVPDEIAEQFYLMVRIDGYEGEVDKTRTYDTDPVIGFSKIVDKYHRMRVSGKEYQRSKNNIKNRVNERKEYAIKQGNYEGDSEPDAPHND